MSDESQQNDTININTADLEQLTQLKGVGPAMAERIIQARPFSSKEELMQVGGIGESLFQALESSIRVSQPESQEEAIDEEAETQAGEGVVAEGEEGEEEPFEEQKTPSIEEIKLPQLPGREFVAGPEKEPPVEEPHPGLEAAPEKEEKAKSEAKPAAARPARQESQPRYITRSGAFWMAATASFFAFVLAVALTLAVLAVVNGGISYANADAFSGVRRQVQGLNSQADILQQDVQGLRNRLENLEGLSGRVSSLEESTQELESTTEGLQADMQETAGQVDQLNQQVETLNGDVEELQSATGRFQNFLDGLRQLLSDTVEP